MTNAVYASLFPRPVRAILLDSGVMPEFRSFGTRRSAAGCLSMSEAVGAMTPRTGSDHQVAAVVSSCTARPPADPPIIRNVQRQLDTPVLLFGTDFDPNTPFSWTRSTLSMGVAVALARRLAGWRRLTPALVGPYYLLMIPTATSLAPPSHERTKPNRRAEDTTAQIIAVAARLGLADCWQASRPAGGSRRHR